MNVFPLTGNFISTHIDSYKLPTHFFPFISSLHNLILPSTNQPKQMSDRNYHCKDVEMLMGSETVIMSATDNLAFLITKRPIWANPFFPDLQARITLAYSEHLGIDNAQALRAATIVLKAVQIPAQNDIAEFKVQIDSDFNSDRPRRDEILNVLGFTEHLKDIQVGDQEALIELLIKFKTNIPTFQAEIITKGMAPASITTIVGYADTLKNANVTQETAKGTRKTITAAALTEFNAIFEIINGICKMCFKFFKNDKPRQDMFSFSKVIRNMNTPPPGPDDGTNPPPPPGT